MAAPNLEAAAVLNMSMSTFDNQTILFTVGDLNDYTFYNVQICIIYASQLGATVMLLLVMAALTRADRRRTVMFGLNGLALLLNFLRMLFLCLYFTGPWTNGYTFFYGGYTGDYSLVPASAYAVSVVASILTLLVLIVASLCLVLQTQVVLVTLPKVWRQLFLVSSTIVATITIALRVVYSVYNIESILWDIPDSSFTKLSSAMDIVSTVSICWFAAIFTIKLGFALWSRHRLGLQRFSAMHVLFIGGGQTMIVPAVFSIIQHFTDIPSAYSNTLTSVVIFLPLSSLWASSVIEDRRRFLNPEENQSPQHEVSREKDSKSQGTTASTRPLRFSFARFKKADPDSLDAYAEARMEPRRGSGGSHAGSVTSYTKRTPMSAVISPQKDAVLLDLERQGF